MEFWYKFGRTLLRWLVTNWNPPGEVPDMEQLLSHCTAEQLEGLIQKRALETTTNWNSAEWCCGRRLHLFRLTAKTGRWPVREIFRDGMNFPFTAIRNFLTMRTTLPVLRVVWRGRECLVPAETG